MARMLKVDGHLLLQSQVGEKKRPTDLGHLCRQFEGFLSCTAFHHPTIPHPSFFATPKLWPSYMKDREKCPLFRHHARGIILRPEMIPTLLTSDFGFVLEEEHAVFEGKKRKLTRRPAARDSARHFGDPTLFC